MLVLNHPEVAFRDCGDCQKYVYDHDAGQVRLTPSGEKMLRSVSGGREPCYYGPDRCAKVSPTAGRELNNKNWRAYTHYLECRAVGQFPDDEIVRQNAATIRAIEDSAARSKLAIAVARNVARYL